MKNAHVSVLLFPVVISFLCTSLETVLAQPACTHYASPAGGGNGLSQNSPFRIADFWGVARPGATLCLLDGVYQGAANMIKPPAGFNGNSRARITVIALHDGAVLINGRYSNAPLVLSGNNWLDIE